MDYPIETPGKPEVKEEGKPRQAEIPEKQEPAFEDGSLKKVEAALFVAGRWLSLQELVTLTDLNPITVKELLKELRMRYLKNHGAIEIIEKENLWKMDVKSEYLNITNRLVTGNSEFTKAEQETLAVIAYKQPVKQSVVIKIRGNKAYEHIKKFIQLGLLKAKKIGHTKELNLSEEFYEYFHVGNSEEEISEHARNSDNKKEFRHIGKGKDEEKEAK